MMQNRYSTADSIVCAGTISVPLDFDLVPLPGKKDLLRVRFSICCPMPRHININSKLQNGNPEKIF